LISTTGGGGAGTGVVGDVESTSTAYVNIIGETGYVQTTCQGRKPMLMVEPELLVIIIVYMQDPRRRWA